MFVNQEVSQYYISFIEADKEAPHLRRAKQKCGEIDRSETDVTHFGS